MTSTVKSDEGWGKEHSSAMRHCEWCGCPLTERGDPVVPDGSRASAIFQRMAWEFRDDPVKTMILMYRVTDASLTLQDIADAIASVVASVHNRTPVVTRQAIMDQINRICDGLDNGTVLNILKPRRGKL